MGIEKQVTGPSGWSPDAARAIESAMKEARSLNHYYVGTEHLLLGLLREGEGGAARVFLNFGITFVEARERVIGLLGVGAECRQREGPTIAATLAAGPQGEDPKGYTHPRFTYGARRVLAAANQEAIRFDHQYIGTEHILLALAREGAGLAAIVLNLRNVYLSAARREVERLIKTGSQRLTMGKLPFTLLAEKAVEHAQEEAAKLKHTYVGTGHLLLGLMRDQDSLAVQVLLNLGIKPNEVREQLVGLMGTEPDSSERLQEAVAAQGVALQSGPANPTPPKVGVGLSKEMVAMLAKAVDFATEDNSDQVLPWHILLVFAEDPEIVAVLKESSEGFSVEALRRKIERRLNTG